ncbi:HAUS augmin-like complex subunit 4 isoform X2 [Osmerus eperlanus]|uniref:HAUS augmin-like complex subunit 4 isoform X2 n=1 Tax=Osmerus eperlanus TaxID=29151 RepID=UPI002E128F3E
MSANADSGSVGPSLCKVDNLHQQVLASFPLCQMIREDLTQNPRFCKLLAMLSQHVECHGLTLKLEKELEMAERDLQTQRLRWLCSESLHRLLREMVFEHSVRKHLSNVPAEDDMFYETMKHNLLVGQCVRQLDLSDYFKQDSPPLLGLDAQQILDLASTQKDLWKTRQRLSRELEKHLLKKCFSLLSYYHPGDEREGVKNMKLLHLSGQLDGKIKRVVCLKGKSYESAALLQQQTCCYISELFGCIQILQSLILDHRLKAQKEIDKNKIEYFEAKCEIVIQKIRAEMMEIQLDTYTEDTISAHRKITEKLEAELKASQGEKHAVDSMLSSFEFFGKEFEVLAEEYSRLRQEIDTKNWALKEFSYPTN